MVTILPAEHGWGDAAAGFGKGLAEGATNRADEMAIQKAVGDLPEGYTPRQLLDAVAKVKTYKPEAKQTFMKNAMSVQDYEATAQKAASAKQLADAKLVDAQSRTANAAADLDLKRETLGETIRHNKAVEQNVDNATKSKESIATLKNQSAENIASGGWKSKETVAAQNNTRLTNQHMIDSEIARDNLNFKIQSTTDKAEQDRKEAEAKYQLAQRAEERKDTQGAEKLRLEADGLKLKADQFDRSLEQLKNHQGRLDTVVELKRQDHVDAQAVEANIKLQELAQKAAQLEAELEEKKRQYDQTYELSLNKDAREQDKVQAEIDKMEKDIELKQQQLQQAEVLQEHQMAIAREKNDIAWKQLEKTNPNEFEKVRQRNIAEEYTKLESDIPEMQKARQVMDEVQALGDQMGWKGAAANTIFGTKTGAELEAKSYLLLKAPIKVFNPSGPLAAKKLDQLRMIYHIKASDTPMVKQGKLAALRSFNDQALKIAEDRMKLIQQYGGAPPLKVMEESQRNAESIVDAFLDYDMNAEPVNLKGLPDPTIKRNGQWPTGKANGELIYSDGTRWLKKK